MSEKQLRRIRERPELQPDGGVDPDWAVLFEEIDRLKAELVVADRELNAGVEIHHDRVADLEVVKAELAVAKENSERLCALVLKAMTESCVTGGEYGGPGCFYCNTEDGHATNCKAAAAIDAASKESSE